MDLLFPNKRKIKKNSYNFYKLLTFINIFYLKLNNKDHVKDYRLFERELDEKEN